MYDDILRKIQAAVRECRYETSDLHFPEELDEEELTDVDAESAILRGEIRRRLTDDPRGVRYVVVGPATDDRRIEVVVRIRETGIPYLITVYVLREEEP